MSSLFAFEVRVHLKSFWASITGSFCIGNDFQFSKTYEGIEVLHLCLFQTHLNDLCYVLHGIIYALAPGVTALESRAANYV
jgi:hypothetical protein